MACRGVHFALTDAQRASLVDLADSNGNVIAFIQEEIEENWDTDWLCETDKAWDAIHRCLTDGTLGYDSETAFHWCILGGTQLCNGDEYIVSFVDCVDVESVANAIAPLTKPEFRKRYDAIPPDDYGVPLSEEDFEYTWANFIELREFFLKAAQYGRSVIFTVDQ